MKKLMLEFKMSMRLEMRRRMFTQRGSKSEHSLRTLKQLEQCHHSDLDSKTCKKPAV